MSSESVKREMCHASWQVVPFEQREFERVECIKRHAGVRQDTGHSGPEPTEQAAHRLLAVRRDETVNDAGVLAVRHLIGESRADQIQTARTINTHAAQNYITVRKEPTDR
jgi:hypothetical protein